MTIRRRCSVSLTAQAFIASAQSLRVAAFATPEEVRHRWPPRPRRNHERHRDLGPVDKSDRLDRPPLAEREVFTVAIAEGWRLLARDPRKAACVGNEDGRSRFLSCDREALGIRYRRRKE